MLARPEVKRTYSRLKKEEITPTPTGCNSEPNEIVENNFTLPDNHFDEELRIAKPDKMRKITDFFRVKREGFNSKSPVKSLDILTTDTCCSSPLTSVTQKLTQTYLDLGQKNLTSVQ